MFNYIQVVFLSLVLLITVRGRVQAQGFLYSTSNPYQNSFAFSTPNLRQSFTTKLANAPQNLQPQAQNLFQFPDQQQLYTSNNFPQRQTLSFPDQQHYHFQSPQQQTAPQQFSNDDQLRQQLAYLQLQQYQQQQLQQQQLQQQYLVQQQQQQQRDDQMYEQFQASSRDTNSAALQNQQEVKTQNLLGVAYSPSTKVSQVKFDSGKLKYDF